mmetsp:Transcript_45116/g.50909  ORF Transcript_45116/g.50909 Transcript_45116/m.50909 type:complete len:91 (-) Transcript_45116:488-760(-)
MHLIFGVVVYRIYKEQRTLSSTTTATKRKNIDVRAFIILKEQMIMTTTTTNNDRFVQTRRKRELNLIEPGGFATNKHNEEMGGHKSKTLS